MENAILKREAMQERRRISELSGEARICEKQNRELERRADRSDIDKRFQLRMLHDQKRLCEEEKRACERELAIKKEIVHDFARSAKGGSQLATYARAREEFGQDHQEAARVSDIGGPE